MSVSNEELIFYKSAVINDTSSNGGRVSSNPIVTLVKHNLFPSVTGQQRVDGIAAQYRKLFLNIGNADNLGVYNAKIYVDLFTLGDDSISLFPATQTDTQAAITGSEDLYGASQLNADVTIGATSITVNTESAAYDFFRDTELIRISDKSAPDSGTGNSQFVRIDGAVSYAGDIATIPLADPLEYNFAAASTRVSSCIEVSEIVSSYASFSVTAAGSGAYDDTTYPIVVDHIGGAYQSWTLDFTSATVFNITGDTLGLVGTGNLGSTIQPINPVFSRPWWTMNNLGASGTFQAGDSISFITIPASYPLWARRNVPAGANSLTGTVWRPACTADSG